MRTLYQRTFDQIQLSEEKTASIRTMLNSCGSVQNTEECVMERKIERRNFLQRPAGILMSVLLVFGIGGTAFACGTGTIDALYQFVTGGVIEQGIYENGENYSAVSFSGEQVPFELREDGKLYLVVNGENKDITDACSYTVPYLYECFDEEGMRHVIVIGGNLDAIGWAEYVWDENGLPAGGNASFGTSAGRDEAPWLDAALEELGLPW